MGNPGKTSMELSSTRTVAKLKRIVEETNADIVIESSWKSPHG